MHKENAESKKIYKYLFTMLLEGRRHLDLHRSVHRIFSFFILVVSFPTVHGRRYKLTTDNILGSSAVFVCMYSWHPGQGLNASMVRENPSLCIFHGFLRGQTVKISHCEEEAWDPDRMLTSMGGLFLELTITDLRCSDTGEYSCVVNGAPKTKLLAPVFLVPTVVGVPEQYQTGIRGNTNTSFFCYAKTGAKGEGSLSWRLKGKNVDKWLGETGPDVTVVRYMYECSELVRSKLDILVTSELDKTEVFCYVVNRKRRRRLVKSIESCSSKNLCGKSLPISINEKAEDEMRHYEPQRPNMIVEIVRNASGYYDVKAKCMAFVGSDGRLTWFLTSGDGQTVSFWPFYSHGWPVSLELGAVANVTKGKDPSEGPTLVTYLELKVPFSGKISTLTCTSQRSGEELVQALSVTKRIYVEEKDERIVKNRDFATLLISLILICVVTFVLIAILEYLLQRKKGMGSQAFQPEELKAVSKRSSQNSRDPDLKSLMSHNSHRVDTVSIVMSENNSKKSLKNSLHSKHGSEYDSQVQRPA